MIIENEEVRSVWMDGSTTHWTEGIYFTPEPHYVYGCLGCRTSCTINHIHRGLVVQELCVLKFGLCLNLVL